MLMMICVVSCEILSLFSIILEVKDMSKFGNGRGTILKFIQMPKIQQL
jgi:hypothetical protein